MSKPPLPSQVGASSNHFCTPGSETEERARCDISVIIPVFNEAESLPELYARLDTVLSELGSSYEILFCNDGSTDGSSELIDRLVSANKGVGAVHLRRNFGKAAALDSGFRLARGRIIITMDADLQDEPQEIPRFLAKLDDGYDVVSGWKQVRNDPLSKTIPSRLFNAVVSRTSGIKLHDFNCGFKAYRSEALENLHLYGELHRYVPALLFWQGFRVTEIPVKHHSRQFGHSKYGAGRLLKGFFDLLTVILNTRYRSRPLHLFGFAGVALIILGAGCLSYLTVLWFLGLGPIGNRPLLLFGLLLVMVGVQLVSTGLLGELVNRSQYPENRDYVTRDILPPEDNDE